jgi:hypothetical protein
MTAEYAIEYEYEIKVRHKSTVDIDDEQKQLFKNKYGCDIEQATDEQLREFVSFHRIYCSEDMIEDSSYWIDNINEDEDMKLLNVRKLNDDEL